MRENRETLQTPTHDGVGRSKKAKSRNVDMHVCRESDGLIVPTKRANQSRRVCVGSGVRRGKEGDQGNAPQAHSRRTQSRGCESQGCGAYDKLQEGIGILHRIPTSGWSHMNPSKSRMR